MDDHRPRLICFSCNFGWGYLSGPDRPLAAMDSWVRVICSGKIGAAHILQSFRAGADGVLILACPEGNCHYMDGNFKGRKTVALIRKLVKSFGLEPERIQIAFDRDPEGRSIARLVDDMKTRLSALGPVGGLMAGR